MPVCPTGASYKRESDGIVLVDSEKCIGCNYCSWACPYGARELDENQKIMKKCTLCVDRIYDESLPEKERKPACVMACPTNARLFGDVNDPESEVSTAIREKGGYQLMPEWGTQPANHYLPRRKTASPSMRMNWFVPTIRSRRNVSCRCRMPTIQPLTKPRAGKRLTVHASRVFCHFSHHPDRRRPGAVPGALHGQLYSVFKVLPVQDPVILRAGQRGCAGVAGGRAVSSFFHLGRPERAWRSAARWRTSWLSREVIVLPAFMGAVAAWGLIHYLGWNPVLFTFSGAFEVDLSLLVGAVATLLCFACSCVPE